MLEDADASSVTVPALLPRRERSQPVVAGDRLLAGRGCSSSSRRRRRTGRGSPRAGSRDRRPTCPCAAGRSAAGRVSWPAISATGSSDVPVGPAGAAAAEAGRQRPLGQPAGRRRRRPARRAAPRRRSAARPPCRCPAARRGRARAAGWRPPPAAAGRSTAAAPGPTAGAASAISPMPPVMVATGHAVEDQQPQPGERGLPAGDRDQVDEHRDQRRRTPSSAPAARCSGERRRRLLAQLGAAVGQHRGQVGQARPGREHAEQRVGRRVARGEQREDQDAAGPAGTSATPAAARRPGHRAPARRRRDHSAGPPTRSSSPPASTTRTTATTGSSQAAEE